LHYKLVDLFGFRLTSNYFFPKARSAAMPSRLRSRINEHSNSTAEPIS
jgi:hypothetical protein